MTKVRDEKKMTIYLRATQKPLKKYSQVFEVVMFSLAVILPLPMVATDFSTLSDELFLSVENKDTCEGIKGDVSQFDDIQVSSSAIST